MRSASIALLEFSGPELQCNRLFSVAGRRVWNSLLLLLFVTLTHFCASGICLKHFCSLDGYGVGGIEQAPNLFYRVFDVDD